MLTVSLTDTYYMTGLPSQFTALTNALGFSKENHRVISQNVANINTPEYRTQQLSFEQLLERMESKQTNNSPGEAAQYDVELTEGLAVRADGNNVDLDRELASLKKNALLHQTLVQLMGTKIGIMKKAIEG